MRMKRMVAMMNYPPNTGNYSVGTACHLNFFDEYLKGKAVDFEEGLAEGAELLETINVEKRRLL